MRKKYNYLTFFFMALVGLCWCCSSDDKTEPTPVEKPTPSPELKERQDIILTQQQKEGIILQNDLAFSLFNAELVSNDKNTLLSPVSITQCLSMAANGAGESVKKKVADNFFLDGGNIGDLNSLNKYLIEELRKVDNSSLFALSNSVWVHKTYSILPSYSKIIKEYYNGECVELDMFSFSAADRINSWVNLTTNGLIHSVYDNAPALDMVCINTMYFRGAWTTPFEERNTEKAHFHNSDGTFAKVDFMNSISIGRKVDINSDYAVVQLNYGNKAYSCYAILPADGFSLNLNAEKWNKMKDGMAERIIDISLPKFEIEYTIDELEKKMDKVGISGLFSSSDSFVNIVSPTIKSNLVKVRQKTVFKVNERGVEGAAMTERGPITFGSEDNMTNTPSIVFDRPFIYIVEEQSSGAILFIGVIRNL